MDKTKSLIKTIYQEITNKINKSQSQIKLYNKDFTKGTYIIDQPGYYVLMEDIIFNPNSPFSSNISDHSSNGKNIILDKNLDWVPTSDQKKKKYAHSSFFLGFYSAINIESSNVILDLNNFTIRQHKLHALQQRFFQVIQCNNSPFIINQGPSKNFSKDGFKEPHHIIIKNGFIGLSSHYGIHGNNNKNIVLENLTITDFECGGISFNHIENLVVMNVNIFRNRRDTPVTADYSILRCAKIYLQQIEPDQLQKISFNGQNGLQIFNKLIILEKNIIINYIKNHFKHIVCNDNPVYIIQEIKNFYHNTSGINDGSTIVGCQITPKGVAIHGFTENICPNNQNCIIGEKSENIYLVNCIISNITSNPTETIHGNFNGKDINGCLGEKIDFQKIIDFDFKFQSNILNNCIFLIDKFSKMNLSFKPITTVNIPSWISNWVDNNNSQNFKQIVSLYLNKEKGNFCLIYGKDIMGHVNKGTVGLRIGGTNKIYIKNVFIYTIDNIGKKSSYKDTFKFITNKKKAISNIKEETGCWYAGKISIGIIFSTCSNLNIDILRIHDIKSINGKTFPILYNNMK